MKKIRLSLIFLVSFFSFFVGVMAYDKAKAPSVIPNTNDLMFATTSNDDAFDFSAISFKNGNATLVGSNDLYKIKISNG